MAIRRVSWGEAKEDVKRAVRSNPALYYLTVNRDERDGFCQIWQYGNCHFVTRIDQNRDGRTLVVCLLSGENLFDWGYELDKDLEKLAKDCHCTKLTVEGRIGWKRLLQPLGYEVGYLQMVKKLVRPHCFTWNTLTEYAIRPRWRAYE